MNNSSLPDHVLRVQTSIKDGRSIMLLTATVKIAIAVAILLWLLTPQTKATPSQVFLDLDKFKVVEIVLVSLSILWIKHTKKTPFGRLKKAPSATLK